MRRALGPLLLLVGIAGPLAFVACSSSDADAPTVPAASTSEDGAVTPAVDASTGTDAGTPATKPDASPPPSTVGLTCLGDTLPITLDFGLPHVHVSVAGVADPNPFLLDVATTASILDMTAFGASPPASTGCDPAQLGELCTFADLDFFGSWGSVTLRTSDASILGTDFFTAMVLTIDWNAKQARRAKKGALCTDAELAAAGFTSLSTQGFYAASLDDLEPLSDVDDQAPAGETVADVPVVPLTVAGVAVQTQLDTGFDDSLVPFSVNVNEAFLAAAEAASPGALVRDASQDISLSTCAGVAEQVDAYTLASGKTVSLGGHDFAKAVVFVKHTPAAAEQCGGIGTYSVPFAQIGNAFFASLGAVVFDPFTSRVWIR